VTAWKPICHFEYRGERNVALRTKLDKALSVFAVVESGEGPTALLLAANLFSLMTAYYIIKPVRDLLVLQNGSAEIRIYASAVAALAFLVVIPIYSALASRVN